MKKAENELQIILNDTVHGSSELLNLICSHILKYKKDTEHLNNSLYRIKHQLIHFPVVTNFIKDIENILKRKNEDSLTNFITEFRKKKAESFESIFKKAFKVLNKHRTILTLSHSKTLIKIFKLWKISCPSIKVIISESRPGNEGILMATEISKLKIKTEIITESMSGKVIKEVDAVILGADQLLSDGNIINKTGSRMLAALAKYHKVPVYVLASSDKMVKKKVMTHKKIKQYKSVSIKNEKIVFRNEDFEEIEKGLITKIFTD